MEFSQFSRLVYPFEAVELWLEGSVSLRVFLAYDGQPPPFLVQRLVPFDDTQLMTLPVRFFTLLITRFSGLSRSLGRAPAYLSTLLYTVLLLVDLAVKPLCQIGASSVSSSVL